MLVRLNEIDGKASKGTEWKSGAEATMSLTDPILAKFREVTSRVIKLRIIAIII